MQEQYKMVTATLSLWETALIGILASVLAFGSVWAVNSKQIEAEACSAKSGMTFSSSSAGYTGTGYMACTGGTGSYIEWNTLRVVTAASYTFKFRYSNGAGTAQSCNVKVNGGSKGSLVFAPTASWANWNTQLINIKIAPGNVVIRLTANGISGPFIDNIVASSFMKDFMSLPRRSEVVKPPDSTLWIWDPTVMKVGKKYHLIVSQVPYSGIWNGNSTAARYEADSLFGPYTYKGVVLAPQSGTWVTSCVCNTKVKRNTVSPFKYLIYFIANGINNVGYASSDSMNGPANSWTYCPAAKITTFSNPAVWIFPNGKIYVCGRANQTNLNPLRADTASSFSGTYQAVELLLNNLFDPDTLDLEDPTIWYAGNQYNMVCTDFRGFATGHIRWGVQYSSLDGNRYKLVSTDAVFDPGNFQWSDTVTKTGRFERPEVVLNDSNEVICLLLATEETSGHILDTTINQHGVVFIPVDNYTPGDISDTLATAIDLPLAPLPLNSGKTFPELS
jgi:hypothetical protein